MKKLILFLISHGAFLVIGFALGIYALPILIAAKMPATKVTLAVSERAIYEGEFKRNLKGSDFLHWGEGKVMVSETQFVLDGRIAPGPNYKLYFSPVYLETEAEFAVYKDEMVVAADVQQFENLVLDLAPGVNPADYSAVIIWCEVFGEFITATRYEPIGS